MNYLSRNFLCPLSKQLNNNILLIFLYCFGIYPIEEISLVTGREEVLLDLEEKLGSENIAVVTQVQAISGLGGVGKTQTVIEYAYRHRDNYSAILWARADTRETLISDFVSIAIMLKLPERSAKDQNFAVNAVKRWLELHTGWLLIFDNAENPEMINDFFPQFSRGNILITTRAQAIGTLAQRIDIDLLPMEEGALFLLRRAKIIGFQDPLTDASETDRSKAQEISEVLAGLPLALDQAGAYIEETGSSLADYLSLYYEQRLELLKWRGEAAEDHPEPVATTWSLSFEKIEQANPAAADLLRLCAFLHPDMIPIEIITVGAFVLNSSLLSIADDLFKVNMTIRELLRFSLIRRNSRTKTLTIHRLVQAVLKDSMDENTQRDWAERTVRAVNHIFPEVEFKNWNRIEKLLLQAQTCAALIEQWNMEFPEAAQLIDRTAYYLQERARFKDVEHLYQQALKIREHLFGMDDLETAKSIYHLARLYRDQGKYESSEALFKKALSVREKILGPEHPEIANNLNHLAELYLMQGKYEEAEALSRRALNIWEKTLSSDHPIIAAGLSNLALLYRIQSKYEEAEALFKRALDIWEKALGPEHPDTARSLHSLAELYRIQSKYEEAEALFKRALDIWEKALGPEHPDTARSLHSLAELYRIQSKYEEAEALFKRALDIWEKALGPEHPEIADNLNHLAELYLMQGKYEEAEALSRRALNIWEKTLSSDHPIIAAGLSNLAELYLMQGKYEEAEALSRRALNIWEKAFGPEHPNTARLKKNYNQLLSERERILRN